MLPSKVETIIREMSTLLVYYSLQAGLESQEADRNVRIDTPDSHEKCRRAEEREDQHEESVRHLARSMATMIDPDFGPYHGAATFYILRKVGDVKKSPSTYSDASLMHIVDDIVDGVTKDLMDYAPSPLNGKDNL